MLFRSVGVGMTKFEKPGRREGWDYPDMAKEVKAVCAKYGIDYKCNPTWRRAIRNYMSVMWKYSFPPVAQTQQQQAGAGRA